MTTVSVGQLMLATSHPGGTVAGGRSGFSILTPAVDESGSSDDKQPGCDRGEINCRPFFRLHLKRAEISQGLLGGVGEACEDQAGETLADENDADNTGRGRNENRVARE